MSPAESAARAARWLQDLVNELPGLRNATSRDPGFKNWRQNAITTMQRIWPGDQDHAERFRRIPFSPVDPRADTRTQRESFSRGCQEANRVLNSFIEEIRTRGVPQIAQNAQQTEESGFEDGFPTVDLPSGDVGNTGGASAQDDSDLEGLPPQGADPSFTPPAPLHVDVPTGPHATPAHPASRPIDVRPVRKGLNVAAKLRDLLGLTGFTGKQPPAPPPAQDAGHHTAPPQRPRSLDIIPVGDEVDTKPRSGSWPVQQPSTHAPGAPATPAAPTHATGPAHHESSPPQPGAAVPPAEAGMSVVMSRPTTLRSSIEKVSIESLISPEFRGGADGGGSPPAAAKPATPASPAAPASAATPAAPVSPVSPAPPAGAGAATPSKIVPLPLPPTARATEPEPPAEDAEDHADDAEATAGGESDPETPRSTPDSAELARATEDFMRSSPVLGATARRPQRSQHETAEHGFTDPDAIAIMAMVDELTLMGIPTTRQSETRARLLDLARRIESADLQWNSLRKAVWFAMEYPEVARRLLPMLLPWIDRAA